MKFLVVIFLLFLINLSTSSDYTKWEPYFREIRSPETNVGQSQTVQELIRHYIGDCSRFFLVIVNPVLSRNTFRIYKNYSMEYVSLEGDTGVSVAKGFYFYIEKLLKCHISWDGVQLDFFKQEPLTSDHFPNIDYMDSAFSYWVYYQNVCTWSYSFVWWGWEEWKEHLYWMAVNGINLALAPFQEDVWTEVYEELGMNTVEIEEHIAGQAFLAWQRMGNIRGWGGPLSSKIKMKNSKLQKKIFALANGLGISLALPAFAGHVPKAFERLFPSANFTKMQKWNNFSDRYCCPLFLDPSDELFHTIGRNFLCKMIANYGTNHIYFADPFNEMYPEYNDEEYISSISLSIYETMADVDPKAVWLLQDWMFKSPFWTSNLVKAFLNGVPIGRMLVLDLQSEIDPEYQKTFSFFGQPYIWCMLHNFGGTKGMHGSVEVLNERIVSASKIANSTMVGVGITPEGIHQNYVMYDFALKMAWIGKSVDLEEWFDNYADRRYGIVDDYARKAWQCLRWSVYNYNGLEKIHGKYVVCRRPSLKIKPMIWYEKSYVVNAWEHFINSELCSDLFIHDLVDVTRQALQNRADQFYNVIMEAYHHNEAKSVRFMGKKLLNLMQGMEEILKTHKSTLLGPWLEASKNFTHLCDNHLIEMTARAQITIWGPKGEIVDYATKQWSGMFEDLFIPRWKYFLHQMYKCLSENRTLNEKEVRQKMLHKYELAFVTDNKIYPVVPEGDPKEVARSLFEKWGNFN